MSLYTSVYWTKRVLVVMVLIIFLCGGFRAFQFVSERLTVKDISISEFRPEIGFGQLNRPFFEGIEIAESINSPQFRISTTTGNLNTENGYPLQATRDPIANVYRITERSISLETRNAPLRIAREVGFTNDPKELSSTLFEWEQNNRVLTIEGLYLLVDYENRSLKRPSPVQTGTISRVDQNALRTLFSNSLRAFQLSIPDSNEYIFNAEYVIFDRNENAFVPSGESNSGSHIRINAIRNYPNLVKTNDQATARAIYPRGRVSNNYVVLPLSTTPTEEVLDKIAEMSIYNWPIVQSISASNRDVQTYPIKTPREAYNQLVNGEAKLVSAYDLSNNKKATSEDLSEVQTIDLLTVRIDNFEPKINSRYIQPFYVFRSEAQLSDKKIELIYILPAILDSQLL